MCWYSGKVFAVGAGFDILLGEIEVEKDAMMNVEG
jgi:hypothetical protein